MKNIKPDPLDWLCYYEYLSECLVPRRKENAMKKLIKRWLGIEKLETEIRNLNNDMVSVMDKQLDEIIQDRIIKMKGEKC